MGLGDFQTALQMRDVLQTLVAAEIERQRPRYQYATVVSINRTTRRCTVQFPGETTTVSVNMGSIQPRAAGQTVRIDGLNGDRFISDVIGETFDAATWMLNAQRTLSGGGIRTVTNTGISWGQRFICIDAGRDVETPLGYFDITMPPDGTVIPVHGTTGGTGSATVSGGLIPLAGWLALYYEYVPGTPQTTDFSKFHIVSYVSDFQIPPNWTLVARRNSEQGNIYWADGQIQDYWRFPTLGGGWVNYGSGWSTPGYKKDNGIVYLKGLMKNGPSSVAMFTLPATYRPTADEIFTVTANLLTSGAASAGTAHTHGIATPGVRLDVLSTGVVQMVNTNADNAFVSLAGVSFPAGQ